MNRKFNFIQKEIRALVIKNYLTSLGKNECVCFTCGNASKYLKQVGLNVTEIINPAKWYSYGEIQQEYNMFDATSGHLPMPLMMEIAKLLSNNTELKAMPKNNSIATGSGETIICLKLAFPFKNFQPVYNLDKSTEYNPGAPLNNLVRIIENAII